MIYGIIVTLKIYSACVYPRDGKDAIIARLGDPKMPFYDAYLWNCVRSGLIGLAVRSFSFHLINKLYS